jgi:hypothetical protein
MVIVLKILIALDTDDHGSFFDIRRAPIEPSWALHETDTNHRSATD